MWISTKEYAEITGETRDAIQGKISRKTLPHKLKRENGKWFIWWGKDDEKEAFAPPSEEETIEELLERRCAAFERYRTKHSPKYHTIEVDGPCALALVGDPHCLTERHEILTRGGWKRHQEIHPGEDVASIDDAGTFVWTPINEVIRREVDEEIIVSDSKSLPFECTTKHRWWASKAVSQGYEPRRFYLAEDMTDSQFQIDFGAVNPNEGGEVELSDDEIELAAWMMTNAGRHQRRVTIYQSKPVARDRVRSLLVRMGVRFSEYTREREGHTDANGVRWNHNHPSTSFGISSEHSSLLMSKLGVDPADKKIPAWAGSMSRRQFNHFLHCVVLADGDRATCNTRRITGAVGLMDDLQSLCVQFGLKTVMYRRGETWSTVSVTETQAGVVKPRTNLARKRYRGTVWCVRVPTGKFFTRFEGRAYLTGNCDDDGCDLPRLIEDTKVIERTEGMFALNIGDTTNNWVGRLQSKYKDQTSTEGDAFRLAKWFAQLPIWKAWVLGNHDLWNQGGIILDELLKSANVPIVEPDEAHIRIVDGEDVFPVLARHSFKGTSIYNEVHGGMRRALFRPEARLYLSGHFHNWGEHSTEAYDGEPMWTLSARGYKRFDDYARAKDFREYEHGCTRVAVINLRQEHPGEHCKTFHDLEEAADFLAWSRKRFM